MRAAACLPLLRRQQSHFSRQRTHSSGKVDCCPGIKATVPLPPALGKVRFKEIFSEKQTTAKQCVSNLCSLSGPELWHFPSAGVFPQPLPPAGLRHTAEKEENYLCSGPRWQGRACVLADL